MDSVCPSNHQYRSALDTADSVLAIFQSVPLPRSDRVDIITTTAAMLSFMMEKNICFSTMQVLRLSDTLQTAARKADLGYKQANSLVDYKGNGVMTFQDRRQHAEQV